MTQFPTQNSRQSLLKISFAKDKGGGENYDLLYQISIAKYEDDLEHYLCFVQCIVFLNVLALQFCK